MKYVFLPRHEVKEKDRINSDYSVVGEILNDIYTEYKLYDIDNIDYPENFKYKVINDEGNVQYFQKNSVTYLSFLELSEYRKMKLDKLKEND